MGLGDEAAGDLIDATDSTVSVRGLVPLEERRLVKKGMKVVIDEPALGIKAAGQVSRVAATPGTNGADNFHVSFDVQVPKPPPNLVGTSVRLKIPVESSNGPVLAVPLSAVSLAADGSSQVERSVNGTVESLMVEPGLVANGYVEVSTAAGTL
ncbi:MAG: peptidoglycan-binding protein, partial [Solirubrobacterales bacterium]